MEPRPSDSRNPWSFAWLLPPRTLAKPETQGGLLPAPICDLSTLLPILFFFFTGHNVANALMNREDSKTNWRFDVPVSLVEDHVWGPCCYLSLSCKNPLKGDQRSMLLGHLTLHTEVSMRKKKFLAASGQEELEPGACRTE